MGQFKNSWLEINQAKATFIRKNKSLWVYFGARWWTPLKKEKKTTDKYYISPYMSKVCLKLYVCTHVLVYVCVDNGTRKGILRGVRKQTGNGDGVYANRQAEGKQTHRKAGAVRLCGKMNQERK